MAINVTSNFSEQASLPLDDRTIFADETEMNALDYGRRYEGLECFVISTGLKYRCDDSFDWIEIPTGSVTAYTLSFLTTDWVEDLPYYYIDVTHNLGTPAPNIVCYDNGDEEVMLDKIQVSSNNLIRVYILAVPDQRFSGTIRII